MKYEEIINLNQSQLIEGIEKLYKNALNICINSKELGEQEQYGIAIALSVLSIEELIKSYTLFLYVAEAADKELFDSAFDTKNLHKSRLKVARFLNTSHVIIDQHKTIEAIEQASKAIDFDFGDMSPAEILKMDWMGDFMKKFQQSEEIRSELEEINNTLIPEAESVNKLTEHTSWFVHAQNQKEKGFYSDFKNGTWHSPMDCTIEEFQTATNHMQALFETIGKPIDTLISAPGILRNIFLNITKKSIEHTRKQ